MRTIMGGALAVGLVALSSQMPAHADTGPATPSIAAAADCSRLADGSIEITLTSSVTDPVDYDVEVQNYSHTGSSFVALGTIAGPETRDLGSIPSSWQGRQLTATFSGQPSQTLDDLCGANPASSAPSPSPTPSPAAPPAPQQAPTGSDAAATLAPCVVPAWTAGASIRRTQHSVHTAAMCRLGGLITTKGKQVTKVRFSQSVLYVGVARRIHVGSHTAWTLQVLKPGTQVPAGSRLSIMVQG